MPFVQICISSTFRSKAHRQTVDIIGSRNRLATLGRAVDRHVSLEEPWKPGDDPDLQVSYILTSSLDPEDDDSAAVFQPSQATFP